MASTKKLADILGPTVVKPDGSTETTEALAARCDCVGIYFSAHWCGPCQYFTPQLAKRYADLKAGGRAFEIVFVSSDRSAGEFTEYFKTMPWTAVPFSDASRRQKLGSHYSVYGIPSLVMVNPATCETYTSDGRAAITSDSTGAAYPWAGYKGPSMGGSNMKLVLMALLVWFIYRYFYASSE